MEHPGKSLPEFQQFHRWLDQEKGFGPDPVRNALYLTTEVGELAKGTELADCLAYLLKLANYTGHDLQEVYTEKMIENIKRTWR